MRSPWTRRHRGAPEPARRDLHDREVCAARAATAEAVESQRRANQLERRLDTVTRTAALRRCVPLLALSVRRAN